MLCNILYYLVVFDRYNNMNSMVHIGAHARDILIGNVYVGMYERV